MIGILLKILAVFEQISALVRAQKLRVRRERVAIDTANALVQAKETKDTTAIDDLLNSDR